MQKSKRYLKGLRTGTKIPYGKSHEVPINELRWFGLNRNVIENHVNKIGKSLPENGMFRPITIFSKSKDGYHDIADASHLYEGINLFEPTSKTNVPVYELDFIDPDDNHTKKNYVIKMNKDRKDWTLRMFLRAHHLDEIITDTIYTTIYDDVKKYSKSNKGLSDGVVVACYTKESRNNVHIKTADFDYNSKRDSKFTDKMLEFFYSQTLKHNLSGKGSSLNTSVLRELVERVWIKIEEWNYDYDKFQQFLGIMSVHIKLGLKQQTLIADKESAKSNFKVWVDEFESSI